MKIIINNNLKSYLNLITTIFLFSLVFSKVYANNLNNYVVSIINKSPITKIDIINRAKLISFSIDKDLEFKNLKKFYNQSYKSILNERLIKSAGLKFNKNINKIVSKKAYELTIQNHGESEKKLNEFVDKLSISLSTILEKYEAQLIWGIILKDKFNIQLQSLDKKIFDLVNKTEAKRKTDLYDLAEIIIDKKNNLELLNQIKSALKQGTNFLNIAKQVSISNSSKYNGKIGWKSYEDLPNFIKKKNIKIND